MEGASEQAGKDEHAGHAEHVLEAEHEQLAERRPLVHADVEDRSRGRLFVGSLGQGHRVPLPVHVAAA